MAGFEFDKGGLRAAPGWQVGLFADVVESQAVYVFQF